MKKEELFEAVGMLPDGLVEEASIRRKKSRRPVQILAAAACLCFILLSSVVGVRAYNTVASYVSVDVNPSLELCLNRWDQVVDVVAFNKDAAEVCRNLSLKHMTYAEALRALLADPGFCAYLDENADLTVTVVSHHPEVLLSATEECDAYTVHGGTASTCDFGALEEAHENHCSVGKYAAFRDLAAYEPELTAADCADMTMHEIHQRIESHHAAEEHSEDTHHTEPSTSEEHHGCSSGESHTHH